MSSISLVLYVGTVFFAAGLIFLVEPMIGKTLLPLLGGSPAVWNTCMVFFQLVLLAGYSYAHALARVRSQRTQLLIHCIVLAVTLAWLPVGLPAGWIPPSDHSPVGWVFLALLASLGGPFFALSSCAPLLQSWFTRTGHRAAGDPYFLYAASNAGSVLALLAYPLVVERWLGLATQRSVWSVAFLLFAAAAGACGVLARDPTPARAASDPGHATRVTSWSTRLRWTLLAFAPSSLMLGVTQHLSTDVSPLPLLWIVPLALYLLSFVVVFSRGGERAVPPASLLLPVLAVAVAIQLALPLRDRGPLALQFAVHLAALLAGALACHGRLAIERPGAERLTGFFLLIACGGALGGVFNALVAPVAFDWIAEYPVALVLACLLRPSFRRPAGSPAPLSRPARLPFALALTALLLIPRLHTAPGLESIHRERTFFGVHEVLRQATGEGSWHYLWNGSTRHGAQYDRGPLSLLPTTYYAPSGPIGELLAGLASTGVPRRMAFIGLGAGTLAAYGRTDWQFTFYEIDPAVARIATDPRFFTYVRDSRSEIEIVLGDARLTLARAPDHRYDVIVVDAFNSDAIPVHLITREAVALYLDKLAPGGILAFHVSSLHLDLSPVLAGIASELGLVAVEREDLLRTERQRLEQKNASKWVVLAPGRKALRPIEKSRGWVPLRPTPDGRVWSDDYSNVLGALAD